jgi:hypothetical protein
MPNANEWDPIMTKRTFAAAAIAVLTLGTAVQAANIVEIAAGDDRFTTLVAAVTAAARRRPQTDRQRNPVGVELLQAGADQPAALHNQLGHGGDHC